MIPGLPLSDWRGWVLALSIVGLVAVAAAFVLSASALRYRNIRKARQWQGLERKWESGLAAVLAGEAAPDTLQAGVEAGEELYFIDFLYKQARGRNDGAREQLAELARPFLAPIAARIGAGDPERRARAVQTISVLGFADHADKVFAALDDASPLVSMIAARTVARTQRPEYVAGVMERLDRYHEWSPKFLTSMLVSMGTGAVPALRETLVSVLHPERIRSVCADALCALRDEESADLAAALLARESDDDLLAACLRLVGKLGSRKHVAAVRPLVESEHVAIRAQAISAVGRLGGNFESALLRQALQDPSPWVVLHAARALRDRGHAHFLRAFAAARGPHTDIALQVLTE